MNILKRGLLALVLATLSVSCKAETTSPAIPKGQRPQPEIIVDGTKLTFNGTIMPLPCTMARYIEIMGHPNARGKTDVGGIIWNNHAIWIETLNDVLLGPAETNPNKQIIGGLKIRMQKFDFDYINKRYDTYPQMSEIEFPGYLEIDGVHVTKDTSIDEIQKHRKGRKFGKHYLPGYYTSNTVIKEYPDLDKRTVFGIGIQYGGDRKIVSVDFGTGKLNTDRLAPGEMDACGGYMPPPMQ